MRGVKPYLLLVGLCLSVAPGLAGGEVSDAMKGIAVSFELLDKHGNRVTRLAHGQSATFRIELTNTTPQGILVTYTPPGYEISVYSAGSNVLRWTTHHEMAFIQALREIIIGPGETERLEHAWDLHDLEGNPLAPNRYEARARLNIGLVGELEPLIFTIK